MNKYKKLLINYIIKKNRIIQKYTGIQLYSIQDFCDIASWSTIKCIKVIHNIHAPKHAYEVVSDAWSCPWCIVCACSECAYGKRNQLCDSIFSRYQRVRAILPKIYSQVSDLPEMINLNNQLHTDFITTRSRMVKFLCEFLKVAKLQGGSR